MTMIDGYMTVTEAAAKLGKARNSITRALANLGAKKTAGVYLIDQETFEKLAASKGAGRPKGAKNKPKD